jgi:hypothetical protein
MLPLVAPLELPPVPLTTTHFSYSSFVWLAACVASQSGNRSQMLFMGTYLRSLCVGGVVVGGVDRE